MNRKPLTQRSTRNSRRGSILSTIGLIAALAAPLGAHAIPPARTPVPKRPPSIASARRGAGVFNARSVASVNARILRLHQGVGGTEAVRQRSAEQEQSVEYLESQLADLRLHAGASDSANWANLKKARTSLGARSAFPEPTGLFAGDWEPVRPNGLPDADRKFNGPGPISGRVNGVAYDPHNPGGDGRSATYYIASAGGGVWKTIDSGIHWIPLSNGPDWKMQATSCIAADPTDGNTVYVGTGDVHGVDPTGQGLMKSTDGGYTWQRAGAKTIGDVVVGSVVVDPDDPRVLLAGTAAYSPSTDAKLQGAVYRSDDGGATWTSVLAPPSDAQGEATWDCLVYGARDASGHRRYYAAGHNIGTHQTGGVWRSDDRGKTWKPVLIAFNPLRQYDAIQIAASPGEPDTVYALAHSPALMKPGGSAEKGEAEQILVARSVTAGEVFGPGPYVTPWLLLPNPPFSADEWSFAYAGLTLACGTTYSGGEAHDALFAGLMGLMRWTEADGWRYAEDTSLATARTHCDQRCMAFNPIRPNEAIVGNDGGVYRVSLDPNSPQIGFENLNSTLDITQYYDLAVAPQDRFVMLASAQDNGSPAWTYDSLARSAVTGIPTDDGVAATVSPVDFRVQATAMYDLRAIFRTENGWDPLMWPSAPETDPQTNILLDASTSVTGGTSRTQMTDDPHAWQTPVAMDPTARNILYVGTNRLWRFDADLPVEQWRFDTGPLLSEQWTIVGDPSINLAPKQPDGNPGYLQTIAVAPSDPSYVYVGSNTGFVFRIHLYSGGGDEQWEEVLEGPQNAPPITRVAVDPTDPNTFYFTLAGNGTQAHVWRCTVGASAITVNSASGPRQPDGTALPGALPDVIVYDIAIDPDSLQRRTLYVATDLGVFYSLDGGRTWSGDFMRSRKLPYMAVRRLDLHRATRSLYAATFGRGIWRLELRPR